MNLNCDENHDNCWFRSLNDCTKSFFRAGNSLFCCSAFDEFSTTEWAVDINDQILFFYWNEWNHKTIFDCLFLVYAPDLVCPTTTHNSFALSFTFITRRTFGNIQLRLPTSVENYCSFHRSGIDCYLVRTVDCIHIMETHSLRMSYGRKHKQQQQYSSPTQANEPSLWIECRC